MLRMPANAPLGPTHLLLQVTQLLPLQLQAQPRGVQLGSRVGQRRGAPLQLCPKVAAGGGLRLRVVCCAAQAVGHQVQLVLGL